MRVIFSLLILVSVGSKAQVVWVTDTAENGARTRYEKHFKTLSQIHGDSADIRINGIYYLKVAKSVFLPQGSVTWDAITNKPVTFTPSAHVHAQSDVTNLTTALAGKANTSHTHVTGDITGYQGYTINVQALTSSPTDGQTVYFGTLPKAPVTAAATSKVHIRKNGTIKMTNIYCFSGTAGSNENWSIYIRINNTTDHLIQTIGVSAGERVFANSILNIVVVAGDYFEIKCVNPTWATNPLTTIFGGYVYIE